MKSEHSTHNKIIPVKSLVQTSKQQNKRNYLQFANKDAHNISNQTINTPKSTSNQYQPFQLPSPRVQNGGHKHHPLSGQKLKGMTVTSSHVNEVHFGHQKPSSTQKSYLPLDQLNYSTKPDRFIRQEQGTPVKSLHYNPQSNKKESSADNTSRRSRGDESEEKRNIKIPFTEKKQSFKSMSLNRGSSDLQKDNSFVSGKLEDQTWNVSKFQNFLGSQKESQSIFKNDLTKIKTKLFQKEAELFEVTQKLQDREATIKDLKIRLNLANEMTHHLKVDLSKEGNSEKLQLHSEIQKLSEQVVRLTNELNHNKCRYEQEEENAATNKKLLMLKVKQYQLQDHERTQFIIQMKEKEKKLIEHYEKIGKGQKQILRQKQSQLAKISQAAQFYKDQVSKNIQVIEELNKNLGSKEVIIRELSDQVSDLKSSLNQLQIRMRELIENEDDLKNQIENKETNSHELSLLKLKEENMNLTKKINQLTINEKNIKEKAIKENSEAKDFQLSMMQKTCDEYKRKIDEYHKYSEETMLQMSDLKKNIIEKQIELAQLKIKYGQPQQKSKSSPRKSLSPIKEGIFDEKEYQKLKHLNLKLFKDNEKMNQLIKEQNNKIYQFYKVNKGLNEVIINKDMERLNYHFSQKWRYED